MNAIVRLGMFVYLLGATISATYACTTPPEEEYRADVQHSGNRLAGLLPMRILIPEEVDMLNLDSMQEQFRTVCAYLHAHPEMHLVVAGHTDDRGTSEFNLLRSRGYADQVARVLRSQSCKAGQMQVMGYGEERPIEAVESPEARAKNRRVEIDLRLRES